MYNVNTTLSFYLLSKIKDIYCLFILQEKAPNNITEQIKAAVKGLAPRCTITSKLTFIPNTAIAIPNKVYAIETKS